VDKRICVEIIDGLNIGYKQTVEKLMSVIKKMPSGISGLLFRDIQEINGGNLVETREIIEKLGKILDAAATCREIYEKLDIDKDENNEEGSNWETVIKNKNI